MSSIPVGRQALLADQVDNQGLPFEHVHIHSWEAVRQDQHTKLDICNVNVKFHVDDMTIYEDI